MKFPTNIVVTISENEIDTDQFSNHRSCQIKIKLVTVKRLTAFLSIENHKIDCACCLRSAWRTFLVEEGFLWETLRFSWMILERTTANSPPSCLQKMKKEKCSPVATNSLPSYVEKKIIIIILWLSFSHFNTGISTPLH